VQELLTRAQQLLAAGPYDARPAEIAAVHDAIWPEKAPVCPTLTCRRVLGVAYFSIQRWAEQQGAAGTTPLTSSIMKKTTTARFKYDTTIYTPHGLGVAYSNTNLTDKAARDIIKNDPDAAGLFEVLPPEAEEGEGEQQLTASQQATETQVEKAQAAVQATPAGFDYALLASAMLDEIERRNEERNTKFEQDIAEITSQQPPLTASTSGAAEADQGSDNEDNTDSTSDTSDSDSDSDQEGNKPVSLSRANKDQLIAFYTAELGQAPAPELTNEDLRKAIAEKRASQQDPE
jgi:hypothetical protein